MPLYEFNCNNCKSIFETLVTDSKEQIRCSICDSIDIYKLFSTFGVSSRNHTNIADNDNEAAAVCCHNTGCGCNQSKLNSLT